MPTKVSDCSDMYKLRMNRYMASLIEFGITKQSPSLRNAYKTSDELILKIF